MEAITNWEKMLDLSNDEIEIMTQKILSQMTLDQKINQLSGDVHFIKGNLKDAKRYNSFPIPAGDDPILGIPPIKFSDGPRGIVLGSSTCFPVSMARGASWDTELEERVGNVIGIEGRAQGATYYGGVCINLLRHPAWGRAQETYGEDPILLGKMGVSLTNGVQHHMMACAKHYATNSIECARFKVNVKIQERTLREIYLPHFKMCVDAGVASIMCAYNKVNGTYCAQNTHLFRDILKGDWNFQGFIISDFVLAIRNGISALQAGMDIEMPYAWRMRPKILKKGFNKGQITIDQINEAVTRILRQKLRFNRTYDPNLYTMDKIACEQHIQVALDAARKSIVLLQNRNQILPLNKQQIKKIAVIGELANTPNVGDKGSSRVRPPYIITPLAGIQKAAAMGNSEIEVIYNDGIDATKAVECAKSVDAVIMVMGYTYRDEGEYIVLIGGDRKSLMLPPSQEMLIHKIAAVEKPTVVCIEAGSSVIMENWKDKIDAILMTWYPGMEGGTALGEIIFGDVNPSAKTPCVFPKSAAQLPYFDRNASEIDYEYYHGYRKFDKEGLEPAFPFGFGLSYTTFEFSELKLASESISPSGKLNAEIIVKNTGKQFGEEVVQVYIGYSKSAVDRPVRELKEFSKVALQPGEQKKVQFTIPASELAYYDETQVKWIVEQTEYTIEIGSSSRESDLMKKLFRIQ